MILARFGSLIAGFVTALLLALVPVAGAQPPAHPILFVTQVPIPADFATIGSVFANHLPYADRAGRGGDLFIAYADGSLRNLTREAGFGDAGFQGAGSIAVRDPAVHWSGEKAIFSMVVGNTEERYERVEAYWQLYEVRGLGQGESAEITRVAGQPARYNNVSPAYGSDELVFFTSDRPRNGSRHVYPQLDEYESTPTVTGLWRLDRSSGELALLDHSPSGDFTPIVDSFGRLLFTRWDHLQRDQQADADALAGDPYGSFDYDSEAAGAARSGQRVETFPEPRDERTDLLAGTPIQGHRFNHFFPWEMAQDGTGLEVLNHLGRHELHDYFDRSRNDDPMLEEFIGGAAARFNPNPVENILSLREDPTTPGRYVGVDAPEFQTHAAGGLVALEAPPGRAADRIAIEYVTDPVTRDVTGEGGPPPAGHSGHYRDPLPTSDGRLLAAHTDETRADRNEGSRSEPEPRYRFRLRWLVAGGEHVTAGPALTGGIEATISYWDPDELVTYSGELWELDPVEVVARPEPPRTMGTLTSPEAAVFAQEEVWHRVLSSFLAQRDLALLVVRDVTRRDSADRQQPFRLEVPGGASGASGPGKRYPVEHLQLYQGNQVRGYGGVDDPEPGRRVLARLMSEDAEMKRLNTDPGAARPAASVPVAPDGSVAVVVPARRALSWQLLSPDGEPVVRERYWLTFQPGEIRSCDGCHGVNRTDQLGRPPAEQPPESLRHLARRFWDYLGEIVTLAFR